MLPKTLTLALLTATAAADRLTPVTPVTPPSHALKRQLSCGIAEKDCGIGCIPIGWTCCPDELGGCGILDRCVMGTNDEYGCCPIGRICVGEGGVTQIGDDDDDLPTPTGGDDDFLPDATPTSSLDDDDDGLDFGDDDDDDGFDLDLDDDDDTTPTRGRPAPTFSASDDDEGGELEGGTARHAVSFVGAIAAAVLAF